MAHIALMDETKDEETYAGGECEMNTASGQVENSPEEPPRHQQQDCQGKHHRWLGCICWFYGFTPEPTGATAAARARRRATGRRSYAYGAAAGEPAYSPALPAAGKARTLAGIERETI